MKKTTFGSVISPTSSESRSSTEASLWMEVMMFRAILPVALGTMLLSLPACSTTRVDEVSGTSEEIDMSAPPPILPNGKPDFSGVWARPYVPDITRTFTNENGTSNIGEAELPFTDWGQEQWDDYDPVANGDYAGSCMPFGWLRAFSPHPMQILQNDDYIAFLFEQSTMFAVAPTDGRPHRDWAPTWFGDSVGHWEGDALVIEALNFNAWAKLDTSGHPFSTEATLTMTFRRPDMGHIEFDWVLDDPKTYRRPISNQRIFVLTPDIEIMEYSCMEGNMDNLLNGVITPWHPPNDEE